jgi:hypothetical protein
LLVLPFVLLLSSRQFGQGCSRPTRAAKARSMC